MSKPSRVERLQGALVGTAVGDALGLPYEGMSQRRTRRMLRDRRLRHRFVFGRGMVSDDTDHACFVAIALAKAEDDPDRFAASLASSLRWWLAALPAGIGLATLRGIARLWLGFRPENSGVWSAGNGPAMRAPLIGTYADTNRHLRDNLVRASTRMTHRDPKAEQGARAIATAAAHASVPHDALQAAIESVDEPELVQRLELARDKLTTPTAELIRSWNLNDGITGYIYDTVPAVLHCWTRHGGHIEPALDEIIKCGGDTDTTGAILGGLAGTTHGVNDIPQDWRNGILEWPRSVSYMMRLGNALATGTPLPTYFTPGTLIRNAVFIAMVYAHIARRAMPPY